MGEKAEIIRGLRREGYRITDLLKISKLPKSTYYYEEHREDYDVRNEEIIAVIGQ